MCYYLSGDYMNFLKKHSKLIKGIFSLILFFSSVYIQEFLVLLFGIKKTTYKIAVILNASSSIIILVILFLLYSSDLKKEWKTFKDKWDKNLDIGIKYWLFGLLGMMVSNIILTFIFNNNGAENEQAVQKMISALPIVMVISAGLIAPIVEEITFRKVFRDNIKNDLAFVLISGIFFGFLHVYQSEGIGQFLYIIPYSCLGISFATMYKKTNTVFTSTMMHMFHNTVLTILSILV